MTTVGVRSEAASEWYDVDGPISSDAGRAPARAGRLGWIVCQHATREVAGGLVPCPRGGHVAIGGCIDCHLLESLATERDPRLSCATTGSAAI